MRRHACVARPNMQLEFGALTSCWTAPLAEMLEDDLKGESLLGGASTRRLRTGFGIGAMQHARHRRTLDSPIRDVANARRRRRNGRRDPCAINVRMRALLAHSCPSRPVSDAAEAPTRSRPCAQDPPPASSAPPRSSIDPLLASENFSKRWHVDFSRPPARPHEAPGLATPRAQPRAQSRPRRRRRRRRSRPWP